MGQGQRLMQKGCAKRVFTATSYERQLMALVVGFHSDVIGCELARRGVWRGAAEGSGSGGVQRVLAW